MLDSQAKIPGRGMHDSQEKSDVLHEMRRKTTPYPPLQVPACKEKLHA